MIENPQDPKAGIAMLFNGDVWPLNALFIAVPNYP
jgi:hypothetical protein